MQTASKQMIGRYEVIQRIGRGSQGSVYMAKDPNLGRRVAIKVLHTQELSAPGAGKTPLEARISSRLTHPNVIPIYDVGEFKELPYLVFEYVQGQTLREMLSERGALSIELAIALIGPILDGVACAHAQGIMHLDLSPRNILIDEDEVPRIMDFGLSKPTNSAPTSGETTIMGTLRYMSPEHFANDELGTYTDVFALASTFYELVTGDKAMPGTTAEEIIKRLSTQPMDLSSIREHDGGDAFATFLEGAFEIDFQARYVDASTMKEAFQAFLDGSELNGKGAASSHSTVEFLLRRMQRKKDFPTISRTLTDINKLTSESSDASADKLANVILRDFALTSKLLKLVNSAFYSGMSGEVTSISNAVVLLGFEKICMIANSLTFFSHMQGGAELKDSMTKSFLGGLIARHLAQRAKLPGAEEAFICGLFQNLGENLVIYYFPEDYAEIKTLMDERALNKSQAARGVLGVSDSELGAAVARTWQLPDSIVDVIRGIPGNTIKVPANNEERFRDIAVFANELCDIAKSGEPEEQDEALTSLLERFEPSVELSASFSRRLLAAGLDKLRQYSQVFEINTATSALCKSAQRWVDTRSEEDEENEDD